MIATPTSYRAPAALVALLGTAFLGLSLVSGCACGGRQCDACGPRGGGFFGMTSTVCFGYSSTCWHAWPTECTACPAYSFPPNIAEPMPAKAPPEAALPPMEVSPVPEPSPSDENTIPNNAAPDNNPAPEEKQSRRSPAPVLTYDYTPAPAYERLPAAIEPTFAPEPAAPALPQYAPPVAYDRADETIMARSAPPPSAAAPPVPALPVPVPSVATPSIEVPPVAISIEPRRDRAQEPSLPSESFAIESHPQPAALPAQESPPVQRSRRSLPALLNLTKSAPPPKTQAVPPATMAVAETKSTDEMQSAVISPFGPPPPVLTEPPAEVPASQVYATARTEMNHQTGQLPSHVSEPARQTAHARRPRIQLPALLNLVNIPAAHRSRTREQAPLAPIEKTPTADRGAPASEVSPYGPPPPVLVEEPPVPQEVPAAIQVTNYKATITIPESGPAMILNTNAESAHQAPPPVLIEPQAAFVEAVPLEATITSEPEAAAVTNSAPVDSVQSGSIQVESQPSHIITDWRPAEQSPARAIATPAPALLPIAQQPLAAPVNEEHLAPIVSPAAVMRRLPPVRAR